MSAKGGPVDGHLVTLSRSTAMEFEQYLTLRYIVEQTRDRFGVGVLAVTSPGVGDGKTTTAINLAGVLAEDPANRVLLVDGDLRRPAVAARLGLNNGKEARGVRDFARVGGMPLKDLLQPSARQNLMVLPAGRRQPTDAPRSTALLKVSDQPGSDRSPLEIVRSRRFDQLIEHARQMFTFVVIDSPPILPVPDIRLMQPAVDGLLVVVAANRTPRQALGKALTFLSPGKVLGLVFNGDETPKTQYCDYYYPYDSQEASASLKVRRQTSSLS